MGLTGFNMRRRLEAERKMKEASPVPSGTELAVKETSVKTEEAKAVDSSEVKEDESIKDESAKKHSVGKPKAKTEKKQETAETTF